MTDSDLADAIITRLNKLAEDPAIAADIEKLIEARLPCSAATDAHPSIQTRVSDGKAPQLIKDLFNIDFNDGVFYQGPTVGFLGMLNGILGTIPDGPKKGYGYIAAVYEDSGKLLRFTRSDVADPKPGKA